jgi:hypothetical protein
MPGHDGTGPMGMGAMSGRAAGTCGGARSEPAGRGWRQGPGIGRGRGRGGRGWRWRFRATDLQQALGELNTRIGELETPAPDAESSSEKGPR